MLTGLVTVLFMFYIQDVLKLKKNNSGAKRLNKPHVTHKTVGITAYKVTDFKTEIRFGQNVVQQIDVVWHKFSCC